MTESSEPVEPVMVRRVESFAGTVNELMDWCAQRGLELDQVTIPSAHLRYESLQSPEEAQRAASYREAGARRHAEWERLTYERLAPIYGPQP